MDHQVVHGFSDYDLEIDSLQPNQDNVDALIDAWKSRRRPNAFDRMTARK